MSNYRFTKEEKAFLEKKLIAIFITIDEKKYPHSVPVLIVEHENKLFLTTMKHSIKVKNLQKTKKVAINITHPRWYPFLSVAGEAEVLTKKSYGDFMFIIEKLARKYKEEQEIEKMIHKIKTSKNHILIEVTPTHVFGNLYRS